MTVNKGPICVLVLSSDDMSLSLALYPCSQKEGHCVLLIRKQNRRSKIHVLYLYILMHGPIENTFTGFYVNVTMAQSEQQVV